MEELSPTDWQKIIESAPISTALGDCGQTNMHIFDEWLREICSPFTARIEREQARAWDTCSVVSISIDAAVSRVDAALAVSSIIAPYCQPGSAFLVAGGDGISSLIRAATKSRFSHVGLIMPPLVTNDTLPLQYSNVIPLWQSYARVPCRANYPPQRGFVPRQETAWGADVSDLAQYILYYIAQTPSGVPKPRFVIRACHQPLTPREMHDFYASINCSIRDRVQYPHPARLALMFLRNRFPYLRAICDHLLGPGPIESGGEFCSMLAARTLFDAGVAEPRGRSADSFMPGDFSLDCGHESTQLAPAGDYDALYARSETEFRFVS